MRLLLPALLLIASSAIAQDVEQLRAARDFGYDGIKLSTSLDDFKRKFPNAQLQSAESDTSANVLEYRVITTTPAYAAECTFCDGKLYQLQIFYTNDQLMRMGGYQVPYDKLAERFGPSNDVRNSDKATGYVWSFPPVNRRIMCCVIVGEVCDVSVTDTTVEAEVQRRKEKAAKLGF